jgi:hypothetical protein
MAQIIENRRYIAVKKLDGKKLFYKKDGNLTENLWEADAVRKIDLSEFDDFTLYTANELFMDIRKLIHEHEMLRDKHADIVNKLEFLKLVG